MERFRNLATEWGRERLRIRDSMLTPLSDYRNDLLVLNGINFLTGNNHEGMGRCSRMERTRQREWRHVRGPIIAQRIGAEDRFSSMEFGVLTIWEPRQTRMSYSSAGRISTPTSQCVSPDVRGSADVFQMLENLRLRRRSIRHQSRGTERSEDASAARDANSTAT